MHQYHELKNDSVVFLPGFLNISSCEEIVEYLVKHEGDIVSKYKNEKRLLSVEKVNGKELIKYFEAPLQYDFNFFNKYINSNVMSTAMQGLGTDVYVKSMEIHSRFKGCSEIPAHQDNAYYGLKKGDALTLYVSLTNQNYKDGGLTYIKNQKDNYYDHRPSNAKGFSLTVDNSIATDNNVLGYDFGPGDCSMHLPSSLHKANAINKNVDRVWVLRYTFYGINAEIKPNHSDWYNKMVAMNRGKN